MKEKATKIFRSSISLLLVACLMLGMCSNGLVALATGEQTSASWNDLLAELGKLIGKDHIDYVSLGASNTNGYGIDGYLPDDVHEDPLAASKADMNVYGYLMAPKAAYPAQIADVLNADLHQLAISSMRTEEALYLLGDEYDYVEDAYMQWRFTGGQKWFEIAEEGGVPALRKAYQDYLTDAEVITIDLGWNNFGVYAFNNIKTILADGNYWKAPDWNATKNVISEEDYKEVRDSVMAALKKNMGSDNGALQDKMGLMLDVLTYATLGAIGHFDSIVEWIYEHNPDAQIVVINIQNLADDLVVEFEGQKLNLGDLYGELIDLVNLYRASESPYANKYAFADAGDVETFLDEIKEWNGDPTTLGDNMVDCFDMYDDNLYVRSIVEYMMFAPILLGKQIPSIVTDMQEYGDLDLNKLLDPNKYVLYVTNQITELTKAKNKTENVEELAEIDEKIAVMQNRLLKVEDWFTELNEFITEAATKLASFRHGQNLDASKGEDKVYLAYKETLNYAYEVVASVVRYAAEIDNLVVDANSLNGFNTKAGELMGYIFNSFMDGATAMLQYQLTGNGVEPVFELNTALFEDPAVTAIAVLAVRYELGNSFFAHPNETGHDQITTAVLEALIESDAGDFTDKKMGLYMGLLAEKYPNLYAMLMGENNLEDVDDLSIIVQMLKMSGSDLVAGKNLDALEAQIRAELRAFQAARTEEQAAEAEAACYRLYKKLIALATATTATEYEVTEDSYYVSLGDSTITGYGLTGYIDNMQNGVGQVVADSAHVVLAQSLYGDEWKNHFGNFCQGSLRADDLLLFLGGEVELDDYYYAEIEPNLMEGTLEATQAKFIENVEKADLISVAIGGGNFLTFAGKYMNRVLDPETNGEPYELDWERIGVDSTDASMAELQDALDLLVPVIDALGLLDQYLPEGVEIENPAKFARALAEGLLYGYASYNYYYTQVLERIKEINPDAQLLILGMFNPVDDWTMTTTIDGEKVTLDIGGAVSNLMEVANLQTLAFALQSDNTSYVDVSEAETILEAENPGKELGFNDYYDSSFKSNGKAVHASVGGHKYIAEQMLDALSGQNIDEEVEAILEEALYIITEYYDEAYAYGYQYALNNGYIDAVVAGIDAAIAELDKIDLSNTEMTPEFRAEVEDEIDAIIETLEAAKALIVEADVLDQATLDAAMALLTEAAEAAEALVEVLEQAGVDVNTLVIIPAIEGTKTHIETVVIPAVVEAVEQAAKAANAYLVEQLGNAYNYMVEAVVTAVKTYLPVVDEALYDYLYNNPEQVIGFFAEYGDEILAVMGEYGDEALAIVAYVLYFYGEDIATYVIENHESILAAMVTWMETYGDRTAALLQVYAEALGLCDAVRDQIAELEKTVEELENELNAKIEAIEKEIAELKAQLETAVGEAKAEIEAKIAALEAELAALKAEIEAKIAEVKAAIAELKAALEAAIESGLTKIEELKAAIENLDEKVAELIEAAKKAALDQVNGAIKNLENAIAKLDEAVYALAGEAYENLKAALKELANELAAQIAEAAKKYFPELADAIYNYLYNNPEEVIDFVKTYGPYFGEIVAEYGDEALAVIGYILYMYGEDMAAYVVENHEEILSALVAWFDVHGENTAALLQVYAEALGLCDAVRDQIAELEAILDELYAALENATGEAKEAIQEEIAKVEAAIAELKAELEALIEKINAIIADVNATVEEAIARVEAAIAELKATVAAVKAAVKEAIETAKQALEDAIIHQLEIVLNKQLENLEEAVEALEEAVMAAVAELKAIVDQLVYDATHAEYVIDMESYYLAIGSDPEFAKLLAQALDMEKNYGVTDWDNVDLESILKADLITLSYNENQLSSFAFNQAFGYVADYVNVEFRNSLVAYVVETMKEVLPKMLPALSDAAINKYVAIISAQINGTIDQYSAEYFGDATASEMDWATIVGSNNVCYVDDARDEMKEAFIDAGVPETYAYQIPVLDYLYENLEMLGELGELMAMFDKEIVYEMFGERAIYTMEIPVVDALTFAGESYAFGYAQFNIQYAETVLTINKINPDAIVVLLGHYNAFQSIELEVNGTSINLGDIYGDFANVTSAHSFVYALLQENTIYVDISDAETVFGAYGAESETSVLDFVDAYLSDSTITSVSAAGHEYIKEQILNALTVIDTRGVIGDADGDGDVDSTDAMLVLQYDAMIIGKDELNLILCDVDGDGDVDSTDAMYILQFDGLLIEEFPVEE